jgi:hypothetical protein
VSAFNMLLFGAVVVEAEEEAAEAGGRALL